MALKLPDSAVPMGDFPVAKAVDIDFNDGENLQEKFDNGELGGAGEGAKTYTTLPELGLTADATIDDVIGVLKDGETAIINTNNFTDYLTMFPNHCEKDQYAILKVERESANRYFIEWRQKEGNAYAIGGLNSSNKFTSWNNLVRFKKDGFADDSIVCIGNAVSIDGTVQTLESLGFSTDILLWENGVYRVSHFGGLVNLPSDLDTINNPAFRLEHHNLIKNNANPNNNINAPRHSIIYCDNGDIYCRFYRSGATPGTYIKDTGWKRVVTEAEITNVLTNTSTINQIPNANLIAGEIHGKFINLEDYSDALTMPSGKWLVDKTDKASQMQNLPVPKAGILEVKFLHGNDGTTPYTSIYRYAMLTYTTIDGHIYKRSFNSDNTVGNIVNDTGWEKIGVNDTRVTTLETQVNELFQSVSDGKTLVANAITDKGVSTPSTATFATMATNISKIPQTTPWKEETVSATPDSTTHVAKFIFSNTVLGVRQLIAPDSNHTPQLFGTKMFTINSNIVEAKVESGTWKMTAMVWNSQLT